METLPGADSVTQELTDQMTAAGWRAEVISAYQTAGGAPYLDYTDTVFGQVYEGMDVVDAIARTGVDEGQRPTEPITINSVTITKYEAAFPPSGRWDSCKKITRQLAGDLRLWGKGTGQVFFTCSVMAM